MTSEDFLNVLAQTLFDKKGFNIFALDVRGLSTITDYFVIVEGNVERHVKALADAVNEEALKRGIRPFKSEGEGSNWCVIDFGDVMVHLFQSEFREHYQLEELWKLGKIVNLKFDISSPEVSHGSK